jgi:hypothetical protein
MTKMMQAISFLIAFGWFFFGYIIAFILATWLSHTA